MLVVENVTKHFQAQATRLHTLQVVSLQVRAGEFVCLLGPSGSGKSTLLRIIGGLIAADSGTVRLDGEQLTQPHPAIFTRYLGSVSHFLAWVLIVFSCCEAFEASPRWWTFPPYFKYRACISASFCEMQAAAGPQAPEGGPADPDARDVGSAAGDACRAAAAGPLAPTAAPASAPPPPPPGGPGASSSP